MSSEPFLTTTTPPSNPPPHTSFDTPPAARRPRIGFKKTRTGCYSCKRRRIKCQENRPACNSCIRIRAECIYPKAIATNSTRPKSLPVPITEFETLQSTPTHFNLIDMRLFHHFLLNAYPHLPIGNDQVWVTELAALSHSVRTFNTHREDSILTLKSMTSSSTHSLDLQLLISL